MCVRSGAVVLGLVFTAVTGVGSALARQNAGPDDLLDRMADRVLEKASDLVALRHDIHRHPELSGAEKRTAGLVAGHLHRLGFEVRTGVGGYGVVGVLRGARTGPMVAFRADMDAVRSSDRDPVSYRSTVPGIRHICGHDLHVAVAIGIAEGFAAVQPDLAGSVMLLFQPAEEVATGAKSMLADGVFVENKPDAIYAVHTAPYPLGRLATTAGGMMAGRASYRIDLTGDGDLEAAATAVQDVLAEASTVRPDAGTQPAPKDGIFVQQFGGARSLPVDGGVRLQGQVMAAGPEMRMRAKSAVVGGVQSVDVPGVTVHIEYDEGFMLGVTNDALLVERANRALDMLDDVAVSDVTAVIPAFSEDFGSLQAHVPGVMYFLGVSNPDAGTVGMPHTGSYVADDAAITLGARAMLAIMLERLRGPVESKVG